MPSSAEDSKSKADSNGGSGDPPSGRNSPANSTGKPDGGASVSAAKDARGTAAANTFKLMLLIMMVLQNTSTVLVGRYTRSSVPKEQLYSVNHLLLVIEFTKLVMSAALEFYATKGRLYQSMQIHIFQRPADALKILVPALLYLVQNTLLYIALSNLTAPIFQVTYQAKLVTTAVVSVIMLQRSYSFQQWLCLVAISVGVAIVVLDTNTTKAPAHAETEQNIVLGLVAVSIACLSSALAGVYFEKVLKKPGNSGDSTTNVQPASLWMRNMQLAFFSVVIAACQSQYNTMKGEDEFAGKPFFHGFTFWPWVLVFLQAGGGLLVAAVIKVRPLFRARCLAASLLFCCAGEKLRVDPCVVSNFRFLSFFFCSALLLPRCALNKKKKHSTPTTC